MLRSYRRWWGPLFGLLLALPLMAMVLAPTARSVDRRELRPVAAWPALPGGRGDWRRLPSRIDAYLADHFGFREQLLLAEARISQGILKNGSDQVLFGRDGWLFYRLEGNLKQAAGLLLRRDNVAETADTLASIARTVEARGARFLVAIPPSSATIYGDLLPKWARNRGRETEYDLLLAALAARGVTAVDLRPHLRDVTRIAQTYSRYDTHWNPRGALEAFNVVAAAAGHPDWRMDPDVVLVDAPWAGGDLARMIGIEDVVSETAPILRDFRPERQAPPTPKPTPFVLAGDRPGPTVLVIGDSFTRGFFPPFVLAHAGRLAWIHHEGCTLDWRWVEEVDADEVWWMPTERILLCRPGAVPAGFAGEVEIAGPAKTAPREPR